MLGLLTSISINFHNALILYLHDCTFDAYSIVALFDHEYYNYASLSSNFRVWNCLSAHLFIPMNSLYYPLCIDEYIMFSSPLTSLIQKSCLTSWGITVALLPSSISIEAPSLNLAGDLQFHFTFQVFSRFWCTISCFCARWFICRVCIYMKAKRTQLSGQAASAFNLHNIIT